MKTKQTKLIIHGDKITVTGLFGHSHRTTRHTINLWDVDFHDGYVLDKDERQHLIEVCHSIGYDPHTGYLWPPD